MIPSMKRLYMPLKSLSFFQKGNHFKKSLLIILLVSTLPGIAVASIVYWLVGGRVERELYELHTAQIARRIQVLNDQFTHLEHSMVHWTFDPMFQSALNHKDFVKGFQETWNISKSLMVLQGSHPLASKIELFIDGTQPTLFKPDYIPMSEEAALANYRTLSNQEDKVFWSYWSSDLNGAEPKQVTLVHKIATNQSQQKGTLLVQLDKDKITDLLKTMTPYQNGLSLLLQEDGTPLVSSGEPPGLSGVSQAITEKLMSLSSERDLEAGSFLLDWKDTRYTVTFGKYAKLNTNWYYVTAAPLHVITDTVIFVSKLLLFLGCAVLIVAFALSWHASKRLYVPLDKLVRLLSGGKRSLPGDEDEFQLIEEQWKHVTGKTSELQTKLEEQLTVTRKGFMLQLVLGYLSSYTDGELVKRMEHYGWAITNRRIQVIYIQLTGLANVKDRFANGDESLLSFAAANIIEETTAKYTDQFEAIDFQDATVGLLLFPAQVLSSDQLQALIQDFTKAVNRILKLQITAAVGRPTLSPSRIPSIVEDARRTLRYRSYEAENQILEIGPWHETHEDKEIRYPFHLEKEIIQSLRRGRELETMQWIEAFLTELTANGEMKNIDVQQGMLQLLGSLQHATMYAGFSLKRPGKGTNHFEQLAQIREPERMVEYLRDMIVFPYLEGMKDRANDQAKLLVHRTKDYLSLHYADFDLSLERCADQFGTNPYFLSRAFKQITGQNFIDYVTELRISNAKDLLLNTDLKVQEVAERSGYQQSYFNRIFKKLEGVTPTQFREAYQDRYEGTMGVKP
ncbi:AraC family transcriptional regulator [Paenibacillus silviterrae]|uniref:AraC family transcriptional regulator n=1 Tax=Paenibacillus silviterrae TaxID=3242194 RepID=UPI002543F2F0|nr:AraC family transcriptional regulator [Paenibacillus chinjuensis]